MTNKTLTFLRSIFWPIDKQEFKKIVPLLLLFCLLGFNQSVLWNLKDSLVVTISGAEAIPFLKVWATLPFVIFFTFIFTKLSNRFSQEAIFYQLTSIFLLLVGLFALIYPFRNQLHPLESVTYLENTLPSGFNGLIAIYRNWTISGFYVVCELWSTIVISLLFWRFANENTQLLEARRFYSVLSIGYTFSIILGGAISASMSYLFNQTWEQAMLYLIGLVLALGLLAMGVFRWMHKYAIYDMKSDAIQKTETQDTKLTLFESLVHVSKSKYLMCIAAIVVCYSLVISLSEVVWKDQLGKLYPDILDYNQYMGQLQMIQGLIALVLSLGLAEGIKRLGWMKTALVTPILMIFASLFFFTLLFFQNNLSPLVLAGINPMILVVFFGTVQNCIGKACKYSFVDSTKEMAYIPLGTECKIKGKTAIDGIGARIGKSGGSFIHQGLLILFTTISASSYYAAGIILMSLTLWIFAVCFLGKKKELLHTRELMS